MTSRPRYLKPKVHTTHYHAAAERESNVIGKRLTEARTAKGLSLAALSELLNEHGLAIKRQGIGKWESGAAVPNAYQLLAVCHALEIEDGIRYFTGSPAPAHELNEAGRKKLREYKEDLIASGRYKPLSGENNKIVYIEMPVSTIPASAGTGAFLEEDSFESLRFPEDTVPKGAEFGVRVRGDSMEPVYHDGQIVWVQRCTHLTAGEVGLFLYDGDGYIKVYGELEPDGADLEGFLDSSGVLHRQPVLISYNETYAPKVVSPELDFRIAGRILR